MSRKCFHFLGMMIIIALSTLVCDFRKSAQEAANSLSAAEQSEGWELLFDGHSMTGWRSVKSDSFPQNGWRVQDGMIEILTGGGDIITEASFRNFIFTFEFNLTPKANSGFKYFIQPGSSIGFEYQVIDDAGYQDTEIVLHESQKCAALYDLYPTQNVQVKPAGEWNQGKILVQEGHIEHWLNGAKVVEIDRFSADFAEAKSRSKFRDVSDFGQHHEGHILIQDHGGKVFYRNLKLKRL